LNDEGFLVLGSVACLPKHMRKQERRGDIHFSILLTINQER